MEKENWDPAFQLRFARHENELRSLYLSLYPGDTHAWDYFLEMLFRCWQERPEELRRIDRIREADPDWYKGHGLVGMRMYVNAFAGTLDGVRKTTRYQNIEVEYLDSRWRKQRQKYSGWTAQIIQHEIDHCEGIII